jgi:thiamine-phosphate pyrophosphorylase
VTEERCRLYLITPPRLDAGFADRLAEAFAGGDVACLQIRLKDVDDAEVAAAVEAARPLCHANDVALIVNDRPDLAAELGADGVHIGAEDGSYADARAAVGADAIVGVSCYDSRDLAMEAAEAGADYIAFGAFFATATKDPPTRAGLDLLRWWQEMVTLPCVAIGGITAENCGELVEAGADFLAVVAGVWDYADGPEAAVRAYNAEIDKGMARRAATLRRG